MNFLRRRSPKDSPIPVERTKVETQEELVMLLAYGHIVITFIIVAQTSTGEDKCEVFNLCTLRPVHCKIIFQ